MSQPPEYLTLAEAAELLRIGERTCYDLARQRRLPAAKVGGQWRIRRADLEAFRNLKQKADAKGLWKVEGRRYWITSAGTKLIVSLLESDVR